MICVLERPSLDKKARTRQVSLKTGDNRCLQRKEEISKDISRCSVKSIIR